MRELHWTAGLHHDGSALYVSNLQPHYGDRVTIKLRAPINAPISRIFLRTMPDGENHFEPMHDIGRSQTSVWYACDMPISMPMNNYRFKIITSEGAYSLNQLGASRIEPTDWHDFRILANYADPKWTLDSVFYQIFPDRFYDGDPSLTVADGEWQVKGHATQRRTWGENPRPYQQSRSMEFFGGDLLGIIQKLDYIQDLGANALYLNPIFTAQTNHRYDVTDFFSIDPHLGGNEALAALRTGLDERGMRYILDITLNHLGWQHTWFLNAQANPNAPSSTYFTFHQHPHNYESWLGHRSLVKLNYQSQALRDVLFTGQDSVMRQWMRAPYRADGWRLDVANMQARQGPIQLNHEIGREIRAVVKEEYAESYLLGENFFDATPNLQGDELDAAMNYQGFTIPLWRWLTGHDHGTDWRPEIADSVYLPGEMLFEQWGTYRAPVPFVVARHAFNLLDSHDTVRIWHRVGGNLALLKLAAVILMTYLGTPSIYYGTEIEMQGASDPDNRRCMRWDESTWNHDLRAFFQQVIKLRRQEHALIHGGIQHIFAEDGLIVYQRQSDQQTLLIVGWRGPDSALEFHVPVWATGLPNGTRLIDRLSDRTYHIEGGFLQLNQLTPGMAMILEAH